MKIITRVSAFFLVALLWSSCGGFSVVGDRVVVDLKDGQPVSSAMVYGVRVGKFSKTHSGMGVTDERGVIRIISKNYRGNDEFTYLIVAKEGYYPVRIRGNENRCVLPRLQGGGREGFLTRKGVVLAVNPEDSKIDGIDVPSNGPSYKVPVQLKDRWDNFFSGYWSGQRGT